MAVPVRLLRLKTFPILEQLQLEEALLRATSQNWLIVNDGTPATTVVMGISGYVHVCVEITSVQHMWLAWRS